MILEKEENTARQVRFKVNRTGNTTIHWPQYSALEEHLSLCRTRHFSSDPNDPNGSQSTSGCSYTHDSVIITFSLLLHLLAALCAWICGRELYD